jgi:hypothetical protein
MILHSETDFVGNLSLYLSSNKTLIALRRSLLETYTRLTFKAEW